MKLITLMKPTGEKLGLLLNDPGSGVDHLERRWVLESERWNCVETGETAERLSAVFAWPLGANRKGKE